MEAIKPRQIINYDAGIVLIDLHQLNVKTTSGNTNQRHWIRGNLLVNEEQNPQNNNPQHRFPNQMIEQISQLLSKKGPGISQPGSLETCRRRLTSEKRAYTSIKSDEEWTSRVLPSEQVDIVNSLNYEGIAVIDCQFYHFPDSDRLRIWLCHRLNSLND